MNFKTEEEIFLEHKQITEQESIIVNLISMDFVPEVYFQFDLYKIYPELERKIYSLLYSRKMKSNHIFPFSKTKFNNLIVSIPCKEKYDDNVDLDILSKNIEKLEDFKKLKKIEKVFFSTKQIDEKSFQSINNNYIYI